MTWMQYLEEQMGALLLHLTGMAALSVFLLATGTPSGVLLLVLLTWLIGLGIAKGAAFLKLRAHLQELTAIMDSLDQKHLFVECIPKPTGLYEQQLFALLRQASRSMVGAVSAAGASQREYREYVEQWVHEIKTPITAAQLICRNADGNLRRKLLPELAQIENHVERSLFYARAESPEQDFIIRKANLESLVAQALAHHRALLRQSDVRLIFEGLDLIVYTDEKWATFLLGQLLQNAVRYRKTQPEIRLTARTLGQQVQLLISDNGIGIPASELSRIFDRGFTGSNGRSHSSSTGMGLYIGRKIADFLQIEMAVKSAEEEGTTFVLTFPAQDNAARGNLSKL